MRCLGPPLSGLAGARGPLPAPRGRGGGRVACAARLAGRGVERHCLWNLGVKAGQLAIVSASSRSHIRCAIHALTKA